jgi:hypothetical protein
MFDRYLQYCKKQPFTLVLAFYTLMATLTIILFNGTGDAGDSVMHYLFARYAPVHPRLFFDHWAKPVFVLLASPFAQFGFTGMKVFNALVALLTILLIYKISLHLKLHNSLVSCLVLIFMPTYYVQTFASLTEHLFGLFMVTGIYLCLKHKYWAASVLISFLPFVRSEGLIILLVFALYFLVKRKWKMLPALLTGHVFYSLAGYAVYHDFLWVFNQNPYAFLSSPYGSGSLLHFVFEMYNATGVPVFLLFCSGVVVMLVKSFKKQLLPEEFILVFLGFASYFIAHSLFWYLGIFNSMGLKRVLVGVLPLAAIMALYGFNFLTEELFIKKKTLGKITKAVILAYLVIFPFTQNPAAVNWKENMNLNDNQINANKVGEYMRSGNIPVRRYFFEHPYLNMALEVDPFDAGRRSNLTLGSLEYLQAGDVVVWDNWFAPFERQVTREFVSGLPGMEAIKEFYSLQPDRGLEFVIYKKIR